MKEILEMFIYKPKKTERIIIVILKLLFTLCFTIWFFEFIGVKEIIGQLTELEKLKMYILKGHLILFLFIYFIFYQTFFNLSSYLFSFIGFVSYWIARLVYFLCFSLVLDFLFSLVLWIFTGRFIFKLRYSSNIDDGFFAFSYKLFKRIFVKAKLMKSKEQRIRSAKELDNFSKQIKSIMIENSEVIFGHLHTLFMFTVLFYTYYFYYLKPINALHPILDLIVFWICLASVCVLLIGYWFYTNFRLLYYFYLLLYRSFHKQDVIEKEMETFINQLAEEMKLTISEENNDNLSESENQNIVT